MRKPRGKLVALLAGAVVVVLVAVGGMFWKDIYGHLFLDRAEETDSLYWKDIYCHLFLDRAEETDSSIILPLRATSNPCHQRESNPPERDEKQQQPRCS